MVRFHSGAPFLSKFTIIQKSPLTDYILYMKAEVHLCSVSFFVPLSHYSIFIFQPHFAVYVIQRKDFMNYQLFIRTIHQELLNALSPDIMPRLQRCLKNNDDEQDCLIFVSSDSSNTGLNPAVALQPYFEQYKQGKDIPALISDILRLLTHIKTAPGIPLEQFTDFEQIKKHLCLKLVSRRSNEQLLHDTPFIGYYDLALVCIYFHADQETDTTSNILIKNQHLALWNITKAALFKYSGHNSPHLMHPCIHPMNEVLQKLTDLHNDCLPFNNMYVLTNEYRYFGAVCMTFPDVLAQFAEKIQSDLILIPSSVHEIIILPAHGNVPENLNEIIISINNERVLPSERLSDHYYFYDRSRKLIQY